MLSIEDWLTDPASLFYSLVLLAVTLGVTLAGMFLYGLISSRVLSRIPTPFWKSVNERTRRPVELLFFASAMLIAPRFAQLPADLLQTLLRVGEVGLLADLTWFGMRTFAILEDSVLANYRIDVPDNLKARKILTQLQMIRRLGSAIVAILGAGIILTTFEGVREIGRTLLASAGVLGVVVGFAGQKTLGMIISGLQVAFTQPIRLDDALIVENEWGRVEEITMTYVVIRIWDQRRMVLPISYFIEKPFQNWTRVNSQLLGTVFLHVDYGFDVDELRPVYHQMLLQNSLWDGRVWNIHVTEMGEKTKELRLMLSAVDSPTLWDLRVQLREALVAWIAEHHPEMLPRARVEIGSPEDLLGKPQPPHA